MASSTRHTRVQTRVRMIVCPIELAIGYKPNPKKKKKNLLDWDPMIWQVCDYKIMPKNQEMCYESKHKKGRIPQ